MSFMIRKNGVFLRAICVILIQAFFLSSVTFAAPSDKPIAKANHDELISNPEKVVIPREYGIVKSKYAGKGGKLIVHIQDAHCNFEAQSNIAGILEMLIKNDGLSFVSVEGADGFIDTSWFKSFPDAEVRKEVASYFMKKGEITGPEFLSITTDYPIKLFGAETREYYIENLNAFTSSYPLKERTEKYFNGIKALLNRLKEVIYSADLKEMDSKAADYESKKIQFNEYVRFLQSEAEKLKINLRQYEDLFKLINVLVYESKIDFNVTDKERGALIDELNKRITKEALTELVNQSISFKVGKISSADYYAYLRSLAVGNGVDLMTDYPNLYNYIIYNSVYSKIENERLFSDIKKLETDIKEKLFRNDDQRTLERLSRHIDTLLGLVNIKLLNDDFDYYKANKGQFAHEVFASFIKDKVIQYGLAVELLDEPDSAVADAVSKLEDFYAVAVKRDKALVDNTLKGMEKASQKIAVLVTGGFHSEGITKLLEKEGVSYIVVCPSITKDVPTPYIQVLTNQRTPLEDIIAGGQDSKQTLLAPASLPWLAGLSEKELRKLYKEVTGNALEGRAVKVKPYWITSHLTRWIKRVLDVAAEGGRHRIVQEEVLMATYDMAMAHRLSELVRGGVITADRAEEIRRSILSSKYFTKEFHRAFAAVKVRDHAEVSIAPSKGTVVGTNAPASEAHVIVLTKPADFIQVQPLRRQYSLPADMTALTSGQRTQLRAIDSMWDKFDRAMNGGKYFDAIILSCSESRINEEAAFVESLRGIAYPENTPVILISRIEKVKGPQLENLNALISRLIAAKDAISSAGLDPNTGSFLFIQLTGSGTRNEPLNHSAGFGSKHRMLTPSGVDYLARTMIESSQFATDSPGWIMRANDQIVLSAETDIFRGRRQGYITAGKKLPVNASGAPMNKADRNNCFMMVDGRGTIVKAYEKPTDEALGRLLPETPGEVNLIPASFFIRRFTPQAVDALIASFSRTATTGEHAGWPLYQAYKMSESTVLIEGGALGKAEWHAKRPGGITRKDWELIRQAAHDFKKAVETGFADLGDDGIFIDTGTNSEYFKAFMDTLSQPILQAHMDVRPDKNGNVIINCEFGEDIQRKIDSGEIRNFFAVNAKILSGNIGSNSVLMNVVARQVDLGEGVILSNVDERAGTLSVEGGYLYTTIWDNRNGEKVAISYPVNGDVKKDWNVPQFGDNKDISFATLDAVQNKAKSSRLQKLARLSLRELFGPVLVIGGAGYVGSFVTEALAAEGHQVIVLDNLYKGHAESLPPGTVFIKGDIRDEELLVRIIEEHKPAAFIHTSALSEVGESVRNPIMYYYYNTICTMRLLDVMAKHGVKKIEFSSTAAVYGEPTLGAGQTITEDFPLVPINPYGNSKVLIERLLDIYEKTHGIISTRLRYFNVAGASRSGDKGEDHGPKDSHLIPLYFQKLLKGGSIFSDRAHGKTRIDLPRDTNPDGTAIRDYIHVVELAYAHILALEGMFITGRTDIFNLGTGAGFSTKEVAEAIISSIEKNASVPETIRRAVRRRFNVEGARPGDPAVLVASKRKAMDLLTVEFRSTLDQIVETALKWHAAHPDGYGVPADSSVLERDNDILMAEIISNLESNRVINNKFRFDALLRLSLDILNSDIVRLQEDIEALEKMASEGRAEAAVSMKSLMQIRDARKSRWEKADGALKSALKAGQEPLDAAASSNEIKDYITNPPTGIPYLPAIASKLAGYLASQPVSSNAVGAIRASGGGLTDAEHTGGTAAEMSEGDDDRAAEEEPVLGVGAAMEAPSADKDAQERREYIYGKYVKDDEKAFRGTIGPMWFDKAIADNITVVFLYDTALEPDAQRAVQAGGVTINKYLGDSVIEFRGRGAGLLEAAESQIDDLRKSGKKFAVVTVAGRDTLSEIESKLMPMVRNINDLMANHDDVRARGARRPISAVLNVEDSRMSPIALYDIGLNIGFNFGEDRILGALNRVAINGVTGDVFKRTDLEVLLMTGYISLRPIKPIDMEEAREAYEAQAAALRSM